MKHLKSSDPELDFLKNGPWDELYTLTGHWCSDMDFYRDDLRFLHHLIDKYLIWITKTENLDLVRELRNGLIDISKQSDDLLKKMRKHMDQLGRMVEDPSQGDAGVIITEHEHLEEEMADFVKSFRQNRKEVFALTEYVIDSEELASLMKP